MNSSSNPERKLILLEGNIGAGKTSLGNLLKAADGYDFIEEPVERWRGGFANNLFEMFYNDMERWSFTFQIMAFVTRAKNWQEILAKTNSPQVILERSIFTDRHVFAKNLYHNGAINASEWELYCHLWDFLAGNYSVEPDVILYLRTPAGICSERIKKRGRSEEQSVPLSYLKQLEDLHDDWLLEHPSSIVLDGTRQWDAKAIEELLRTI